MTEAARTAAARVVRALLSADDGHSPSVSRSASAGGPVPTVAVAESLTSGLVASLLAEIPGVSRWFLGGVVAYSHGAKERLLGVDGAALERFGAVTEDVARQMARGVAERLGARWAVATTGVAGPGPADGEPAGTAWLAVVDTQVGEVRTRLVHSEGGRDEVRWGTAAAALEFLAEIVEQNGGGVG